MGCLWRPSCPTLKRVNCTQGHVQTVVSTAGTAILGGRANPRVAEASKLILPFRRSSKGRTSARASAYGCDQGSQGKCQCYAETNREKTGVLSFMILPKKGHVISLPLSGGMAGDRPKGTPPSRLQTANMKTLAFVTCRMCLSGQGPLETSVHGIEKKPTMG